MVQCGMLYSAVQNGVVWYVWYGMGVVGLMLCGKVVVWCSVVRCCGEMVVRCGV